MTRTDSPPADTNGTVAPHTGQIAQRYLHRGWRVVPIPPRSKNPGFLGWESSRITFDQVSKRFKPNSNIGLLLGEPSGWLVDIDLDCDESVRLAEIFLPKTELRSGRESSPHSHRWYTSKDATTKKFQSPDGTMLVELRSTGAQTVVHPSRHDKDDELYVWHEEGEPAKVGAGELTEAVSHLAAASLLARHWPSEGGRYRLRLLFLCGLPVRERREVLGAVFQRDRARVATEAGE